ncbi:MAG TPA: hypothetical protein VF756_16585 [Thermoanaerobaculia bacterium]
MNGRGPDRPGTGPGRPAPGQGAGAAPGPGGALRELMKSMLGFSWAMSLFGAKSMADALAPDKAAASLDAVTHATEEQLGQGGLRGLFQTGDRIQRSIIDMMFAAMPGSGAGAGDAAAGSGAPPSSPAAPPATAPAAPVAPLAPVDPGRLDRNVFVVLGEGLAAGAGDFALWDDFQHHSFPRQMARQMQTDLVQPILQQPGIGNLPGFPPLPVEIPGLMQTTVLDPWPPPAAISNLSVPSFRLADALHLRPKPPLVHRDDARQTAANLILGMPDLLAGAEGELPTQLELALRRKPTLALVALGYLEAIEAVVTGDTRRLPDAARCRSDYVRLLKPLREGGAEVLVMNVPDPIDTACVSSVEGAGQVVRVEPSILLKVYGLREDDLITVRGLVEIGYQFLSRGIGPLPQGCVLSGETAGRISARIREINAELVSLAREHGAHVCDLHGLFRRVRTEGVDTGTGSRRLTAGFLGGFYTLNGYYPGWTGQALIANEALRVLNQVYGASFPRIDLGQVAASDPVVLYQPAGGPLLTADQLPPPPPAQPASGDTSASVAATSSPVVKRSASARRPVDRCPPPPLAKPLELPPGLEQVLPLNKERSYFGDALRAVDCLNPQYAPMGACGGVLFGGLALMDSHLSGQVRIRFSPPVNNVTQIELSVLDGLIGDDGILAAPQFFKLPGQMQRVTDFPGMVSTALLDLTTGQLIEPPAATPSFNFQFLNTALLALINVNPNFPQVPITFPGQYGTAVAQFTQREDGKLDFELLGTTFLPLQQVFGAQAVRFPLPFAGFPGPSPQLAQFASIPTRGLALHPHIHLSTRETPIEMLEDVPEIPTNTVRELTFITHNTSFGDDFTLTGPFLGGQGRGRSQLTGRLHVQFGEREGNTVPIHVSAMIPGGLLAPNPQTPYWQNFQAQGFPRPDLLTGPIGFNEFLRFPLRNFFLDDVFLLSDPFDLPVGAVDVRTGEVIGGQLHRGFIGQDVFFALIRIEPRTPSGSFLFHGPASFQKTPRGEMVYRFCGEVHISYPEGFFFPEPNLAMGFPAGPGSSLDPFFWIRAVDGDPAPPSYSKKGSESNLVASNGDVFSYSYDIPADPARGQASFTYENHSQQGSFRLRSLSWVHFANAPLSRAKTGDYDVVTFAGYGIWSKNGDFPLPVTVQISTARNAHYVGIQVNGGATSNVNTKPPNLQDVVP